MSTYETSTGHLLTVDAVALTLTIAGPTETMDAIPESEIDTACAAEDVTCTYEALDEHSYRLTPAEIVRAPTHTWILPGIALEVCCNGGNVYLPTDRQADPSVQPRATYEVADYDEEGNEQWIVLVAGRVTTGKLIPISR